jgi:hypothetical protein
MIFVVRDTVAPDANAPNDAVLPLPFAQVVVDVPSFQLAVVRSQFPPVEGTQE